MRICQVQDVDIVPNTGAVRSGPIIAEHVDLFTVTHGYFKDERNDMGLDLPILTSAMVGTCYVEVA